MIRSAALLLALILCLSLAACGAKNTDDPSGDEAASSAATESSASTAASETTVPSVSQDEVYSSVQEYIDSPAIQSELESAKEYLDGMMTYQVYAEGEKMVYDYQYTTEYDAETTVSIKEKLDESLESSSDAYSQIVEVLRTHVSGIQNPQIEVIYRNGDGTVITSRLYE